MRERKRELATKNTTLSYVAGEADAMQKKEKIPAKKVKKKPVKTHPIKKRGNVKLCNFLSVHQH